MFNVRSFIYICPNIIPDVLKSQTRNTFILKRRNPVPLHKKGGKPPNLRQRQFIYDLVEDTNTIKKPDLKVILTQYVEGVGNPGDLLTLRPQIAYKDYLLPGLAVYASPENIKDHKVDESKPVGESKFSSPYVERTMNNLSRLCLQITMSKSQPWKLEPWHVRASFRKAGFIIPESAIEMPSVEISGPDLTLQNKEFLITVNINNKEKVNVRCRIHHWATGLERLPWDEFHWRKPADPLIPQQAQELENMPLKL